MQGRELESQQEEDQGGVRSVNHLHTTHLRVGVSVNIVIDMGTCHQPARRILLIKTAKDQQRVHSCPQPHPQVI